MKPKKFSVLVLLVLCLNIFLLPIVKADLTQTINVYDMDTNDPIANARVKVYNYTYGDATQLKYDGYTNASGSVSFDYIDELYGMPMNVGLFCTGYSERYYSGAEFGSPSNLSLGIYPYTPPPSPSPSPNPSPTPTPSPGGGNQTGQSGQWKTLEGIVNNTIIFSTYGADTSGRANFTRNLGYVNDIYGVLTTVNLNITAQRPYWGFNAAKRFYMAIQWTNGNESYYQLLYAEHVAQLLYTTKGANFGIHQNENTGDFNNTDALFYLQMLRSGDTLNSRYGYLFELPSNWEHAPNSAGMAATLFNNAVFVCNETFTPSVGFWNNVTLNVYIGHEGSGIVEGSIAFSSLDAQTPIQNDFGNAGIGGLGWLTDIWNFLAGGFSFILGMVAIFTGIMLKLTPYLPYLALFYLLDVAAESIRQGSFQPIGAAFRWTFDLFLKAYDTVIHLGQLVWDAITFWT
jgi:hypothetical protein